MDIMNFDLWTVYAGASEGSGRSEKEWIQKDGQTGLFKYPKSPLTSEHISEKIASMLCELLNIPCARIDIGYFRDRIGSISYNIVNTEYQILLEGIWFISTIYKDFNPDTLFCEQSNKYYSISMIRPIIKFADNRNKQHNCFKSIRTDVLKMIVFDALIGNSDRHQSNWAFIYDRKRNILEFSPLYDNGSSLCSYVLEEQIEDILRDSMRFNSLVDTKSRTRIRIDENSQRAPTHREMLCYVQKNYYHDILPFVSDINCKINCDSITSMLKEFPDSILSPNKKQLIYRFILAKRDIIHEIFCGEER